jgi:hypothetical protein
MLGTPMMDWVLRQVDCGYIVTVDDCGRVDLDAEFSKQIAKPTALSSCIGDTTILGFSA